MPSFPLTHHTMEKCKSKQHAGKRKGKKKPKQNNQKKKKEKSGKVRKKMAAGRVGKGGIGKRRHSRLHGVCFCFAPPFVLDA